MAHWRKIRGTSWVVLPNECNAFPTVRAFAASMLMCCLNLSLRSKYTPSHLSRSVDSWTVCVLAETCGLTDGCGSQVLLVKCISSDFLGSNVIPSDRPHSSASCKSFCSFSQFVRMSVELVSRPVYSASLYLLFA